MSTYTEQADAFMENTATTLTTKFIGHKLYFPNDKEKRDVYACTLSRNGETYNFRFGQSIVNSTRRGGHNPTAYDILACMQKYDVGSFDDFLSEFGYEIKSKKDYDNAMDTYIAVLREYNAMLRLFGDVMDELQEIS